MKALTLILLTLSLTTVSMAAQTSNEECPAMAESNKREAKIIKENSEVKTSKESLGLEE